MDSYNHRENLSKQLKDLIESKTVKLKEIGYSPLLRKLNGKNNQKTKFLELDVGMYSELTSRLSKEEKSFFEEVMSVYRCKEAQENA